MSIRAAGGILWRDATRAEFAVVHRRRYGDWCLPKGKLQPGETLVAAARREVKEETGWEVELADGAGEVAYDVAGEKKTVTFWNMTPKPGATQQPTDPEEVQEVQWFELRQGLERLSYQAERGIVRANVRP